MSKLYSTDKFLTLARLGEKWAPEIGVTASQLIETILLDTINGRLDGRGPLIDGEQWGVGLAMPDDEGNFRFALKRGTEIGQAFDLSLPSVRSFVTRHVLITKEAALACAEQRQIAPPSWWSDRSSQAPASPALQPPARRGYAAKDQPLLEEMDRMLKADPPEAETVWAATGAVVDRAAGGGQPDAKRKRLADRYRAVFQKR